MDKMVSESYQKKYVSSKAGSDFQFGQSFDLQKAKKRFGILKKLAHQSESPEQFLSMINNDYIDSTQERLDNENAELGAELGTVCSLEMNVLEDINKQKKLNKIFYENQEKYLLERINNVWEQMGY